MELMNLRNVDLNLILPLQALLEERSVTLAAKRVHLSQPAMSRALERLRDCLDDDLLIREEGEYQLTPRATELVLELMEVLPRLQQLWSGQTFEPATSTGRLRVAMMDGAAALILPGLVRQLRKEAPQVKLDILTWTEESYNDLIGGKIDLVFSPLAPPPPLVGNLLFDEHFTCLVAKTHHFAGEVFLLDQYLKEDHINIGTRPDQINIVDRPLAEMGMRRSIILQVPFAVPAVLALEGTGLVVTLPAALGSALQKILPVRLIRAPQELASFHFSLVWHPRAEKDALHTWFRQLASSVAGRHAG